MKLFQHVFAVLLFAISVCRFECTDADEDRINNTGINGNEETRYIIKFKNQYATTKSTNQRNPNPRVIMSLPKDRVEVMTLESEQELQFWKNHVDVEYIEADSKIYLYAESIPWGISSIEALKVSDEEVSNQKVCIIDSGYSINHPDLPSSPQVVSGTSQIPAESWSQDGIGHGTHVAGIIAAIKGNNRGIVGVNRNGELKLHIVKIFNNEGNWSWKSDLLQAVESCVNAGATVINMSLGGPIYSSTEKELFDRVYNEDGIIVVAAAGNSGNKSYSYPASYSSVMSVAAIDSDKNRAIFSQYNDQVDIAAPGVSIQSTFKGGIYQTLDGTSMSSPYVAGVAALVWSHFPNLTAQEIRNALESSAEDLGRIGRDNDFGHGLIRADLAYNLLAKNNGIHDDCKDIAWWFDNDGPAFDCAWYGQRDFCSLYGKTYGKDGKTAQQACCACGGGEKIDENHFLTASPTSAPFEQSEPMCGCSTCTPNVFNKDVAGFGMTLIQQIEWLNSSFNLSEKDACILLCEDYFNGLCDKCNPLQCNSQQRD